MIAIAPIAPGDRVELALPAWIARKQGFASREVAGTVLAVTERALQVRAHVMVRESETCQNCGRAIDNPASRLLGFGPHCSDSLGLPHAETYAAMSPAEREAIRNRVASETVVECWLPRSQVEVRMHEAGGAEHLDAVSPKAQAAASAPASSTTPNLDRFLGIQPAKPGEPETPEQYRARWAKVDAYLRDPEQVAKARASWENAGQQPAPPNPRRVTFAAGAFRVEFPFNTDLLAAVKRVPGAAWQGEGKDEAHPAKHWLVPARSGADLLRFAAEHGFSVDDVAVAQAESVERLAETNRAESRAADADLSVEGLGGTLRPFQRVGVRYMQRVRRGIIADQMRLGKTPQAIATIHVTDAFPALLVVPATLKPAWRREVLKWLPGRSVVVLEGEAPTDPERRVAWEQEATRLLTSHEVSIINWEILADWAGAEWNLILNPRTGRVRRRKLVGCNGPLSRISWSALSGDEYHKHILSHKSQRSMVLEHLAERGREAYGDEAVQMLLSGTPMRKNTGADYIQPLKIVGQLDAVGGWHYWATEFCGYANGIMGALPVPVEALERMNALLRSTCMVRRKRSDVFSEIPKVERHPVPFAIDNRAEYERAERDVVSWAAQQALANREFNELLASLSPEERKAARAKRYEDAAAVAARAEGLVKISALKRLAARGKMAAATEWIANFLEESGEKIIIGAWHQEVVEAIAARFKAPFLHGGVSARRKEEAVHRFQRCLRCGQRHELHYNPAENPGVCSEYEADMSVPVVAINFQSGGMGLTLTAANDTVVYELGWTPDDMDQLESRVGHIDKMDPANHWYLLAENTIEEDMLAVLEERRKAVSAGTDGEGREETPSIMEALLDRMAARAAAT